MVLVGAFDERRVRPMIEKYLGSIQPSPNPKGRVPQVTPAPFKFPRASSTDSEGGHGGAHGAGQHNFPVNIPNPDYNHKTGQATPSLEGSVALTREKLTCVRAPASSSGGCRAAQVQVWRDLHPRRIDVVCIPGPAGARATFAATS